VQSFAVGVANGNWNSTTRSTACRLKSDPIVEPCRPTEPLTTPALPGNYYAGQAYKHGCEDEYSNQMKARFGGEW
jgi:hypothetical protein